jgi:SAM-dependent methyltransferase
MGSRSPATGTAQSEPYQEDNLLDALTSERLLELHDEHVKAREASLLAQRLGVVGGDVLSVGAGWHPGRHMFPSPAYRLVAVDSDPAKVAGVIETGRADEAVVGGAGGLGFADRSFDVVLYRLVLHHITYQGPLTPSFVEAARLLRPGGALVAVEPGLWHPVGFGLALANRVGVATAIHGTPDDIPLSPLRLMSLARDVGLRPELHALTYAWRRMPAVVQQALWPLDRALGSRPRAARFGHTLMLIARREG